MKRKISISFRLRTAGAHPILILSGVSRWLQINKEGKHVMMTRPAVKNSPVEQFTDFRDMLLNACQKWGPQVAFQEKIDGSWVDTSYHSFLFQVMAFGCGLAKHGMQRQSMIAVASENRVRWGVTYLAAACGNAICVPIDRELKSQEFFHILYTTGAPIFTGSQKYVDMVKEMRHQLPALHLIINMDDQPGSGNILPFSSILEEGVELLNAGTSEYPRREIDPGLPSAILYTSGTSGSSKGVVLCQRNIIADIRSVLEAVPVRAGEKFLSVLPIHHAYECTVGFLAAVSHGITVAFAESLKRIPENLYETRASLLLGVPQLFETIYRRIYGRIREHGMFRFKAAKMLCHLSQSLINKDLRPQLFRKVHDRTGGRLWLMISGGAAIDPAVSRGFRELGFMLLQGYGMTETSPVLTANRLHHFKDDSAGLPLPGVELKIADGEVLAKGDMVMLGYHQNPEATAEVLQDGWLRTGDLGYLDHDGFLFIQGRKKAVIVLSSGKNVYPEEVEYHLNQSPYILESLVWEGPDAGRYCEEVHAILVPDIAYFDEQFGKQGRTISEDDVTRILKDEVNRICSRLANYKRIRKFTVQWEELEKTTTRKIKRYLYTGKILPVNGSTVSPADGNQA